MNAHDAVGERRRGKKKPVNNEAYGHIQDDNRTSADLNSIRRITGEIIAHSTDGIKGRKKTFNYFFNE